MGNFPGRGLIKEWLKAGFVFQGKFNPTEQGTPQGGVISPLLANIGLHGLEDYIKATNPKLGVVRYLDDFIVTARDKKSLETAQSLIQAWLSMRGLEFSTLVDAHHVNGMWLRLLRVQLPTFATENC